MTATLDAYYAAREAEELALEAAAGTRLPGLDRTMSGFYRQAGDGKGAKGREPTTLRRWLVQTAAQQPSPADLDALDRAEIAELQDVHAQAEADREQSARSDARRAELMAAMIASGKSYRHVAALVGVSATSVHRSVHAHYTRNATDEHNL